MKTALTILCRALAFCSLAFGSSISTAQSTPPLTVGVLPNVSARILVANYQPMRAYLARETGRPVEIATANGFRGFHEATLRGDYDLVVSAANLGRIAQLDARWAPLAIYEPTIQAVLVTATDAGDNSPTRLRGKVLALSNPQSLVALRGLQWLQEQGLTAGRDFRVVHTPNEDSLGALIRSGEAPMAIMSGGEFRQIGEPVRKTLRIATEIGRVSGFWVMANPRLSADERRQLGTLLLAFPGSDDGKAFLKATGFQNIRAITSAEQSALDPFVQPTRAGLTPE
jgi:phosphonate transport system substrate-binding protein